MSVDFARFAENSGSATWRPPVGEGWWNLVYYALDVVDRAYGGKWKVGQIKQKYGELRIYIDGRVDLTDDDRIIIDSAIDTAENVSEKTCETCGAPGLIQPWDGNFYQCLCRDHARRVWVQRPNTPARAGGQGWWPIECGPRFAIAGDARLPVDAAALDARMKKLYDDAINETGRPRTAAELMGELENLRAARWVCRQ